MSVNNTEGVSIPAVVESVNSTVHGSLHGLLISHTFLTLLIPLIMSLFYFSTPESRQRPVFLLNLAAMFLAFIAGVLIDVFTIYTVFHPQSPQPLVLGIVIGFLIVCQSILVDFILLVRLISVYPPRLLGPIRFPLLIAIPVLLKLARVVNLFIFSAALVHSANGPNAIIMTAIVFEEKPYVKIEWATQMIDNTYVSLAFLWRMRDRGNKLIVASSNSATLAHRIHTLFRIALTNFIVPTILSIAQFISVYRGVNLQALDQLILANLMFATFCVAFATIWAGNISQQGTQQSKSKRNTTSYHLTLVESESGLNQHHSLSVHAASSEGNVKSNE